MKTKKQTSIIAFLMFATIVVVDDHSFSAQKSTPASVTDQTEHVVMLLDREGDEVVALSATTNLGVFRFETQQERDSFWSGGGGHPISETGGKVFPTDFAVGLAVNIVNALDEEHFTWEWLRPDGALHERDTVSYDMDSDCWFVDGMTIDCNDDPNVQVDDLGVLDLMTLDGSEPPGIWTINFLKNGVLTYSKQFWLVSQPEVSIINAITSLPGNTDTSSRVKVADVVVTDADALGTNELSLSGADAAMFEVDPNAVVGAGSAVLYLKAGAVLDYVTNPILDVTVAVDDPTVGTTPDDTAPLSITIEGGSTVLIPRVALANTTTSLPENTDTSSRVKVADIVVLDDASGTNELSLSGADAAMFEIEPTAVVGAGSAILYLKAGAALDYETNPILDVTVAVDDPTVGTTPDNTASLQINITLATGALIIDRYSVRLGRTIQSNVIKMSGRFDVPGTELVAGEQIQVRILASGGSELFSGTITINAADLRRGVYTYRGPKGSSGTTLIKLDTNRHTFELSVTGIDLSGLTYPLTLELTVGDYLGSGQTN